MNAFSQFAEQHEIKLESHRIPFRTENASDWSKDARHFACILTREGSEKDCRFEYSVGSGIIEDYAKSRIGFDRTLKPKTIAYVEAGEKYCARYTPPIADVLESLHCDVGVLDSGDFEDWASDLGYDTDSRTGRRAAERIYNACRRIAKQLRDMMGAQLFEAFRDIEPE